MLLFNQSLLDSLHYMTTVFKITSRSDSAHNDTLTYICANDNNNSEENKLELVGRSKHQDALKKENRYAGYNNQF